MPVPHIRVSLAVSLLAVTACVDHQRFHRTVTTTAVHDLGCQPDGLHVEEVRTWAFHAQGCGREGWYRCHYAGLKVCCRPAEAEEARAVFAPHRYGGHSSGAGQVCES